ncbi:HAMP domain-containing sensor histidine kinase [Bythopirellula polymerisocia]|uniref:histidine kinase n=1 Tax=Bythopirellula polymerisocia TaxID=2528003 RepID=A0A5C6CJY3_9BACT|nr:ATP-binding protein [Bythopirellula polymerisocia]TWU23601.1 Alkaline phosphatase synthesis sensor protein PhoR [Bythopirellula polymerisocia]
MWSSRLFWKLFIASAALVILAVGACVLIVSGWQEEQLVEQARHRLRDTAALVREDIGTDFADGDRQQLQEKLRRIGASTNIRFTIVDVKGNVLADSEQDSLDSVNAMENHLARKEFVQASRNGEGQSRRQSPTLGIPFLYYNLSIRNGEDTVGFVRAALPVVPLNEQVASIHKLIALVGLGVALTSLIVAYWLTKRLVSPINVLTEAAEAVAEGRYSQRIRVKSNDDLGRLARSFERMSSELGTRETQLRESIERQTTVLEGMVEGVIAVDRQEHVLFANSAAGKKLRFSPDNVAGLPLLEVVRSHELRAIVQQALKSDQPVRGEIAWQTKKSPLTLEVQATQLAGIPPAGVVLVLHDISELKRLEGLRQQFVANVSHELKTPLSSIKAYTETLLNGALNDHEHVRHFLTRIDDQSTRLHELILDLLSIARIESGQTTLEFSNLPIHKVVHACIHDYEERARAGGVTLINQVTDTSLHVRAEEEGLLQILNNLVDNAIKYTPEGGTVTIGCHTEGDKAVIEVSDTGSGIDPEHHDRLFERFYRVDKARSRELGGTGLGLAIVKHLCNAMQGSISVESSPGQGSTFAVRLRLADSHIPQTSS